MDSNRRTAFFTLKDIEENSAFSNLALNYHIKVGKPKSTDFVRRLVYGVLENKIYLDYIIQHYIKTAVEELDVNVKTLLRMGIYQIEFMDSVPEYAAVTESVKLAKRYSKGREGFINAVLRNYIRTKDKVKFPDRDEDIVKFLSIKYSYAPWIIRLWLDQFDISFLEELLEAGNQIADLVIRPNLLKLNKKKLRKLLEDKGYIVEDGYLAKNALHVKGEDLLEDSLYKDGMFSVQDESSMIAVEFLDPKPNEVVIDVCAAPGGKSIYAAELMDNKGEVIAQDIYKKKLGLIEKDAERNGITIISTRNWDSTRADSKLLGKADRVIVDAPCSGLGVIRRKPEIKYKDNEMAVKDLPKKQLSILTASSRYVKNNGILLYSTCTINREENQNVVNEFIKYNKTFEIEDSIQLFPNINGTDGFYICKMRRRP
ncbi:MAG: 16S rRNA (cytosine(967)-C(5))-methyltransferase RsmB [Clostridiales bacterium]|nr:16S rRNA (cytosine(967)-C(5))-methyltransferase RsmB [Clostridiales bacterium]